MCCQPNIHFPCGNASKDKHVFCRNCCAQTILYLQENTDLDYESDRTIPGLMKDLCLVESNTPRDDYTPLEDVVYTYVQAVTKAALDMQLLVTKMSVINGRSIDNQWAVGTRVTREDVILWFNLKGISIEDFNPWDMAKVLSDGEELESNSTGKGESSSEDGEEGGVSIR